MKRSRSSATQCTQVKRTVMQWNAKTRWPVTDARAICLAVIIVPSYCKYYSLSLPLSISPFHLVFTSSMAPWDTKCNIFFSFSHFSIYKGEKKFTFNIAKTSLSYEWLVYDFWHLFSLASQNHHGNHITFTSLPLFIYFFRTVSPHSTLCNCSLPHTWHFRSAETVAFISHRNQWDKRGGRGEREREDEK